MKLTLISLSPDIRTFGIRTLSACLKREGHNVQVIFLTNDFWNSYKDQTLNELVQVLRGSDLIGVSVMTNFFDNAVQITRRLKQDLPVPVIWGGIHPTIRPEECLDFADRVCAGEGEGALVEFTRKMEAGEDLYNVGNIWFKDKGKVIKNRLRPLIQNLDSIPFPDYDYEHHYISKDGRILKMNRQLLEEHMPCGTIPGSKTYMTIATRGCPFSCTYCCNNKLQQIYPEQKVVRKRSVDNIMKELARVRTRIPFIDCIWFEDDAFFAYSEEELKEFCVRFKKDIGLTLKIHGLNPSAFTREKLALLADAGLQVIRMGIQTGNEGIKRLYKRHYSNQQIEQTARTINEFKDRFKRITYDVILDNPWESDEDLVKALIFFSRFPVPFSLNFFSLTFYPETELYKMAKKEGIITDDLTDVYRKYYLNYKRTYLNNLFLLLSNYAKKGKRISPAIMSLLVNRTLRKLRLSHLLYIILRLKYLLDEGLADIRKRDPSRITRYIKKHWRKNERR
jgi:radical SAM superfamily enzyme YgiQ (UPF0313 family)